MAATTPVTTSDVCPSSSCTNDAATELNRPNTAKAVNAPTAFATNGRRASGPIATRCGR